MLVEKKGMVVHFGQFDVIYCKYIWSLRIVEMAVVDLESELSECSSETYSRYIRLYC